MTIGYAFSGIKYKRAARGAKKQQSKQFVPKVGASPEFKEALKRAMEKAKEQKHD